MRYCKCGEEMDVCIDCMEDEIDRLAWSSSFRGARVFVMRQWLDEHGLWKEFVEKYPGANDWFDERGNPR